jgi:hypothetical protein
MAARNKVAYSQPHTQRVRYTSDRRPLTRIFGQTMLLMHHNPFRLPDPLSDHFISPHTRYVFRCWW